MPKSLRLLFILAISAIFILLSLLPFSTFLTNTTLSVDSQCYTQLKTDQHVISAKIWGHGGRIHVDKALELQMDISTRV